MATELSSQPEPVAGQEVPVCDACREYDCKLKLPGEFEGAYLTSREEEKDGALCILHFGDPHKDAEKCARAVEDKISNKDFNFRGVLFSCPVEFNGEMENANFGWATFSDAANFLEATFSSAANFYVATFSGEANFEWTTFSGAANFRAGRFSGAAHFWEATFSGEAEFQGATFSDEAHFQEATFKEAVRFEGLAKSRDDEGNPTDRRVRLDFIDVTLDKPDKVHFRDVDMWEVSFVGTDVRKVEFTNVQWPERLRDEWQAEQGERKAEKDEWEAAQGEKWFSRSKLPNWRELREAWRQATKERKDRLAAVEKLCHQLRQNYEDQRNYPDAGRFYHGEMEMRRKSNPWRRYLPSLTTLYWFSSGYGQRPLRAGLCVVLLFLLFGWLYTIVGLQVEGESTNTVGAALLHTAEVLTFTRERTYSAVSDIGRWLSIVQMIVMPLQVALLVLAVRRRFQR